MGGQVFLLLLLFDLAESIKVLIDSVLWNVWGWSDQTFMNYLRNIQPWLGGQFKVSWILLSKLILCAKIDLAKITTALIDSVLWSVWGGQWSASDGRRSKAFGCPPHHAIVATILITVKPAASEKIRIQEFNRRWVTLQPDPGSNFFFVQRSNTMDKQGFSG